MSNLQAETDFGVSSIAKLLLARKATNSRPSQRSDGRFVTLVIEGGAMRGVVSAGMVAALEQLGMAECFDAVYGSSAGAITGAYFVAKQARYGTTIFYDNIANRNFIDTRRIISKHPVVSLEFLVDQVCCYQKPLSFEEFTNSGIPLYVVAASLNHGKSIILKDFKDKTSLFTAMKASARIPLFAGPPVHFEGDRLLDASLYESIPYKAACADGRSTDLVVLLTRPSGSFRSRPGIIDRLFVAPYLEKIRSGLGKHYLARAVEYRHEIAAIKDHTSDASMPRMLPIQIPASSVRIAPFETTRSKLVAGAMAGFRSVYWSFGLTEPELVEIITPFDVAHASGAR